MRIHKKAKGLGKEMKSALPLNMWFVAPSGYSYRVATVGKNNKVERIILIKDNVVLCGMLFSALEGKESYTWEDLLDIIESDLANRRYDYLTDAERLQKVEERQLLRECISNENL